MPSLERFVYKTAKKQLLQTGRVVITTCDPNSLVATRPYIVIDNLSHKRRRASPKIPEGIMVDNKVCLIDGHRKAKEAITIADSIDCRVFLTDDPVIINKVRRIAQMPIMALEVRGNKI